MAGNSHSVVKEAEKNSMMGWWCGACDKAYNIFVR